MKNTQQFHIGICYALFFQKSIESEQLEFLIEQIINNPKNFDEYCNLIN